VRPSSFCSWPISSPKRGRISGNRSAVSFIFTSRAPTVTSCGSGSHTDRRPPAGRWCSSCSCAGAGLDVHGDHIGIPPRWSDSRSMENTLIAPTNGSGAGCSHARTRARSARTTRIRSQSRATSPRPDAPGSSQVSQPRRTSAGRQLAGGPARAPGRAQVPQKCCSRYSSTHGRGSPVSLPVGQKRCSVRRPAGPGECGLARAVGDHVAEVAVLAQHVGRLAQAQPLVLRDVGAAGCTG
jgi:hypothetical protein